MPSRFVVVDDDDDDDESTAWRTASPTNFNVFQPPRAAVVQLRSARRPKETDEQKYGRKTHRQDESHSVVRGVDIRRLRCFVLAPSSSSPTTYWSRRLLFRACACVVVRRGINIMPFAVADG